MSDEQEDIAPGAGFPDPDPDFDYGGQNPEVAFGEVAEGEVSVKTANGNRVRFKVSEPPDDEDAIHVIRQQATGFIDARREVCEFFVDVPELTDEIWGAMKAEERLQLEDECLEWWNIDRHINEDVMAETLEKMQSDTGPKGQ